MPTRLMEARTTRHKGPSLCTWRRCQRSDRWERRQMLAALIDGTLDVLSIWLDWLNPSQNYTMAKNLVGTDMNLRTISVGSWILGLCCKGMKSMAIFSNECQPSPRTAQCRCWYRKRGSASLHNDDVQRCPSLAKQKESPVSWTSPKYIMAQCDIVFNKTRAREDNSAM